MFHPSLRGIIQLALCSELNATAGKLRPDKHSGPLIAMSSIHTIHMYAQIAPLFQWGWGNSDFVLKMERNTFWNLETFCKGLTGELTGNRKTSYFTLSNMSSKKFHINENNFLPEGMETEILHSIRKPIWKKTIQYYFSYLKRKQRKISNSYNRKSPWILPPIGKLILYFASFTRKILTLVSSYFSIILWMLNSFAENTIIM